MCCCFLQENIAKNREWLLSRRDCVCAPIVVSEQFQEVENVQQTGLCNRLARAAVVKSKVCM